MRERLVFEVADRELHDGVLAVLCLDDPAMGSVRLVMNGKYLQSGHSSACEPTSWVRRTISPPPRP